MNDRGVRDAGHPAATSDGREEAMTETDGFTEGRRVDTPHRRVFVRGIPGQDQPELLARLLKAVKPRG